MPTATQVSGVPVANAQPVRADVRGAIARASESTGVDFDYLLAQARLESGLNPDAKARSSSATGLYQFIDSTRSAPAAASPMPARANSCCRCATMPMSPP